MPDTADWAAAILAGDRARLARAVTLLESTLPAHRQRAQALLQALLPHSGGAMRVGLSGVPGVGKSSLIERLGLALCDSGRRLAVLAVDPSSQRRSGSILGDKTRMAALATHPHAYIRPSPSGGALGGVAARTRESLLLMEAAGFDVVLVETVGVGQSETLVAEMTDCYVLLMLPGAGDELQGIKKGVLELADLVAVNKADGEGAVRARQAVRDYRSALALMAPRESGWSVPVLSCSALSGEGVTALWDSVTHFFERARATGALARRRREQQRQWLWALLEQGLREHLEARAGDALCDCERAVVAGELSPAAAAQRLLAQLDQPSR